jgi:hypothetical protein
LHHEQRADCIGQVAGQFPFQSLVHAILYGRKAVSPR